MLSGQLLRGLEHMLCIMRHGFVISVATQAETGPAVGNLYWSIFLCMLAGLGAAEPDAMT